MSLYFNTWFFVQLELPTLKLGEYINPNQHKSPNTMHDNYKPYMYHHVYSVQSRKKLNTSVKMAIMANNIQYSTNQLNSMKIRKRV